MNEDFMLSLSLNPEKSKALYMESPKRFGARECYTNIYRAITNHFAEAQSGTWKVAYGYYSIGEFPNLLARHCFIIDDEDHVIDPTIYTHDEPNTAHSYHVMYVFPTIDAYLQSVMEEDYRPGLANYLQQYEAAAHAWAKEHHYYLCG